MPIAILSDPIPVSIVVAGRATQTVCRGHCSFNIRWWQARLSDCCLVLLLCGSSRVVRVRLKRISGGGPMIRGKPVRRLRCKVVLLLAVVVVNKVAGMGYSGH